MNVLQCEICGGKLMAKADGIFECTSCGMLYDKNRVQEMVQEIKGIVQVEGLANADSLLRRGNILLEDCEWTEADSYFEKVLSAEPENARAYLGKLLAAYQLDSAEKLSNIDYDFTNDTYWLRVKKYAKGAFATEIDNIIQHRNIRLEEIAERSRRIRDMMKDSVCPINIVQASGHYTIGLKSDGTLLVNVNSRNNSLSCWKNIVAIAAGSGHVIGLKPDETLVTEKTGNVAHDTFVCEVPTWSEIVAVSAKGFYAFGLKENGTVVTTKHRTNDYLGQCEVSGWKNIIAISAGITHTVGLKTDGTVVACGSNQFGQCEVSDWQNIIAIAAGGSHTVGLRADGTVVATSFMGDPENYYGACEVSRWKNIVAISAGTCHTVGLKEDGTVVATEYKGRFYSGQCNVSGWRDIVAIMAGEQETFGVKANGEVLVTSPLHEHLSFGWRLFEEESDLQVAIARNRTTSGN